MIILAAFSMAGCTALDRQELALEALRGEVRGLAGDLGDIEQSVNGVSGRVCSNSNRR